MPPTAPYDDQSLPFFTVGQVSAMLDVQQPFLRRLEDFELVAPERSDGNQRRYSRDDVDKVSEIVGLIDEGLTLAGVRRVLELQAEVDSLKRQLAAARKSARRS
jgi:MerR family transcriptional regulator/heat shock protein HspR